MMKTPRTTAELAIIPKIQAGQPRSRHLQTLPGQPPRTPSDLARLTGLTTGTITGVINRLERDGYVQRKRAPTDRRKVIVVLTGKDMEAFDALFGSMVAGFAELCAKFSLAELRTITEYLEGCVLYPMKALTYGWFIHS